MRLAPALVLACSIVPGLARAAVVSYSAPAFGAASAVENTIPAFDPSLGTLVGAQFRLTGTLSDSFAGRVRYSGGPTGQGDAYTLDVVPRVILGEFADLPFGHPLAHDTLKIAMDGFGGDYSGGYSVEVDLVHEFYPEMFHHIPRGDVMHTLAANTYISDYLFRPYDVFRPEFRGTATMTYTYSLVGVPEPSSLALFALGLAGCLAVAARRGAGVAAPRRRSVTALALAGLMAPVAAQAAVVSYSAPAFGAESGMLNTIADFDPALGTLERVQLRLTGTVSDSISGAIRQPHHSSDDGDGGKPDPDISAVLTTGIPYVFFYPSGSYHPFQGIPVTFYTTIVRGSFYGGYSTGFDSAVELPAEIFGRSTGLPPNFFGDAPDGGKTYALGAGTASSDGPYPTWYSEARPEFRGTATILYSYRPVGVAEPASLAVLGLGATGCLAARVSRRRRV